jgi:DNA-binding beta-propeller fold protein YncE
VAQPFGWKLVIELMVLFVLIYCNVVAFKLLIGSSAQADKIVVGEGTRGEGDTVSKPVLSVIKKIPNVDLNPELRLGAAQGIAVSASGTVYVADPANNNISIFDNTGAYLSSLTNLEKEGQTLNRPYDVAINDQGDVFVADTGNSAIEIFREGSFRATIGRIGESGDGEGQFSNPLAVALDSNNNLYVVDTDNNRVQIFDDRGVFITAFGRLGQEEGQFNNPTDIALGPEGEIYVLDSGNNRVQVFDSRGRFSFMFGSEGIHDGQFASPTGLAVAHHVYLRCRT